MPYIGKDCGLNKEALVAVLRAAVKDPGAGFLALVDVAQDLVKLLL